MSNEQTVRASLRAQLVAMTLDRDEVVRDRKRISDENSTLRWALEKIKNGGLPNGVPGTVEERMLAMCAIAGEALTSSGTDDEAKS